MYFPLFVGVLCLSLFRYALLCVHFTFCNHLKEKAGLFAIIVLQMYVTINVLWLFLTVPWVGLQYVSVVYPDHTHLLFGFTTWLSPQCVGYIREMMDENKSPRYRPGPWPWLQMTGA